MPGKKKVVKKSEQQKMVGFGTAIARFWTNYVNFNGVAQRSEFWFWVLFNTLVTLPFQLLGMIDPVVEFVFLLPWWIVTFIPWLALYSRRFHDAGFSAKWLWVPLVVLFGSLFVFLSLVFAAPEMIVITAVPLVLAFLGFGVFWLVVMLLPSKLKNNPYRK